MEISWINKKDQFMKCSYNEDKGQNNVKYDYQKKRLSIIIFFSNKTQFQVHFIFKGLRLLLNWWSYLGICTRQD